MDVNILKYIAFVKTVEYGSFTRAAELLNYSQSGISRMISDLEKDWNLSLLERSRAGIRLTSSGKALLPYAKGVCEEYSRLQMQVDELNGLHSGLIRIGTISSVAAHWLPNIIKEFQKTYPNIDYELVLGHYIDIEHWIAEGRVDCGFLRLPTNPEFDTIPLGQDKLLVVLPEDHPLTQYDTIPIDALADYPFMLLEKDAKTEISELFEQHNVKPKVHFTTSDDYAIMSMVEKGLGISILPELILKRTPYHIVTKELNFPARRTLGLAMRDKKRISLAVTRLIEHLDYRTADAEGALS